MKIKIGKSWYLWNILSCLIFCCSGFSQNNHQPNQNFKFELTNEGKLLEFPLPSGRLVKITTTSPLGFTAKVSEPNGNVLPGNNLGSMGYTSDFYFITSEKGTYKIELKLKSFAPKPQTMDFRLTDLRTVTADDGKRIDLQNQLREAETLRVKGDAESKALLRIKYEAALVLAKQVGDETIEGEILVLTADLRETKAPEKDIEKFTQALEIFKRLQDKYRVTHTYLFLGNYYRLFNPFTPEYKLGIETFKKCVEVAETTEINLYTALCSINIGVMNQLEGEYSSVIEHYRRALSIFQKFGTRGELIALQNLIILNVTLGDVQQTLRDYSQFSEALVRFKRANDCPVNLQIALLQYNLQNWSTARELFKTTRSGCQEKKDLPNAVLSLVGQGATFTGEGEYEKALPILNSALAESRIVNAKLAEGTALTAIGVYYDAIGDSHNAIKFSEEAKVVLRQVGDTAITNIVFTLSGKNYLQIGELEKAETSFQELFAKSKKIQISKLTAAALFGLAQVADKRGDFAKARQNIEESIKLIEAERGQIPTDVLRVSFFASIANYYDFYTDLLMRLHRQNPESGDDKLAFQVAESSSARSLLNQLREAGTDIRAGVSPELLAREKRLREELNGLNAAQFKMLTTFALPKMLEQVRSNISRLNAEYEQTQAQIFVASPAFAALTQPKPLSLKETQSQLDEKTILLKYSLGEERSYVFVVTADSFKTFELPKRAEIEARIWNFRRLATVREQSSNTAEIKTADAKLSFESAELSQILLGKIGDLTDKRLAIIPSGALQFLPFAALQNPQNKGQYLIQSNEITVLPSVSVLAVQRQEKRKMPTNTLAVFADPVYEKNDPRLLKIKESNSNLAKSETRGTEADNFLNVGENFPKNFQRLIYSRREATEILALVPDDKKKFSALDFEANYQAATNQNLGNFRYLHFATHGIFNAQNPNLSGVVLSLFNKKGETETGLLSLQDVYNLRLNSDLVVLSACRTGLGKQIKGEGVIGLTRGFMYAGSRRVVAGLWKVRDDVTAELMKEFYGKMLREGKRPAEALRLAQIQLLKKNQSNSPFFWAGFVHYGEWE